MKDDNSMAKRNPGGLGSLSLEALQSEIKRRQRKLPSLGRARAKIVAKLNEIDAKIAALAGLGSATKGKPGRKPGAKRGGGRRAAGTGLIDVLHKAVGGKTVGVDQAVQLAKDAGYVSDSPNFKIMVNAALLKKTHFKRISRGQYTTV